MKALILNSGKGSIAPCFMDGGKAVSLFCFRGKEISCFGDGEFYKIQKNIFSRTAVCARI